MKAMRMIYRGHLLPPFVTPFSNIRQYMQLMHPAHFETISGLSAPLLQIEFNKKMQEYRSINNSIKAQVSVEACILPHTQLQHYRSTYIMPIRKLPFFYDQLHKAVLRLRPALGDSYQATEANISKKEVYRQFFNHYYNLRRELLEKEKLSIKQLKRIEPCLYFSPIEMARDDRIQWDTLDLQYRNAYEQDFQNYLAKQKRKLEKITTQTGLLMDQLLQLMRDQFTHYSLPASARNILFPS